jgi:hypothetical protein
VATKELAKSDSVSRGARKNFKRAIGSEKR